MSRIRWWVLSLLFFATTINYLDRIVLSFLAPVIRKDIHLPEEVYGYVTGAFSFAYMIGFLFAGKFIDRYGTRVGYAAAIAWWSVAAACHALARSAFGLGFWRGMLGLGESGNFPAAIKSVAEWFPKKDRALATGIFNAGSNVAAMAAMKRAVDCPVVASGGVTTVEDVVRLAAVGMDGCIIGRALYEGTLSLREAITAGRRGSRSESNEVGGVG